MRVWLSASDHLPSEVRQRLRQFGALARLPGGRRIPPVLLNGYGMVELGGLAMMGIELSLLPGSGDLCFPVPPFRIRVADENGQTVRAGVTGECQIRRRGIGSALLERHRATPQGLLTSDGWLRTGDLATRNRLGLIRLVGRMKDVIKSGGYSVYVRELEEAIAAHPAVARAAAFGLPHKEKGEIPAAAVELHAGSTASEERLAGLVPREPRALQSPAPHLDSRSRRPAAEPHRQGAPPSAAGAFFQRGGLKSTAFPQTVAIVLRWYAFAMPDSSRRP